MSPEPSSVADIKKRKKKKGMAYNSPGPHVIPMGVS